MVTTTVLDDVFLRCRTYNHSWDEFYPLDVHPPTYGWRWSLRGVRCGSERFDNVGFKGRVV